MSRTSGWVGAATEPLWFPFSFFTSREETVSVRLVPVSLSTHNLTDFDMCSWWVRGLGAVPLWNGKVLQGFLVNGRSPLCTVKAWNATNFAWRNYTQGSGLKNPERKQNTKRCCWKKRKKKKKKVLCHMPVQAEDENLGLVEALVLQLVLRISRGW